MKNIWNEKHSIVMFNQDTDISAFWNFTASSQSSIMCLSVTKPLSHVTELMVENIFEV